MFGRRVEKSHPRVGAYGAVDELNAAIGFARAFREEPQVSERLLGIQKDLVVLMGELAVLPEDRPAYRDKGYRFVDEAMVGALDAMVKDMEARGKRFEGWDMSGVTPMAGALHLARAICRRAERDVLGLGEDVRRINPWVARYLNRLSDVLWLMARVIEEPESEGRIET